MNDQQEPNVLTEVLSLLQTVTETIRQRCPNSDDILHALTEIKAALAGMRVIQPDCNTVTIVANKEPFYRSVSQTGEALRASQQTEEDVARLREQVQEITTRFPDGITPWDSLPGATETQGVIIEFLHRQGIQTRLSQRLCDAAVDLYTGRECLMLTPPPAAGGKKVPLHKLKLWTTACAVVTLLIDDAKLSETDAVHQVVNGLRQGNWPVPGGGNRSEEAQGKSLSNWRDKLISGRYGKDARGIYWSELNAIRQQYQGRNPDLPSALADLAEALIADWVEILPSF